MRPEAIGRGEVVGGTMRIDQRGVRPGGGVSPDAGKSGRWKWRGWVPFALALIPAAALPMWAFRFSDLPEQIGFAFMVGVVLPAVLICEGVGLGHFNILGANTIPDWALFGVMMLIVYIYCVVFWFIGRFLWWLGKRVAKVAKVRGDW